MSKTPEEYLAEQEFQSETQEREKGLTSQERAFLKKYLGLDEKDLLEKLGIEAPKESSIASVSETDTASPAELTSVEVLMETEPAVEIADEILEEPEDEEPVEEFSSEEALQEEEDLIPDLDMADSAAELSAEDLDPESEAEVSELSLQEEDPEAFLKSQNEIQLVSMVIGKYEYTMPINFVQEVVRYLEPTVIPEAPPHLAGVVNLRGKVTPVFKLSKLLNIKDEDAAGKNKFIVVCRHKNMQFGLLVHTVETMYRVEQNVIEWNVESRIGGNIEIVTGLMKKNELLVGILSITRLVERVLKASGGSDG